MAWNRSEEKRKEVKTVNKKSQLTRHLLRIGVIVFFVVLVITGLRVIFSDESSVVSNSEVHGKKPVYAIREAISMVNTSVADSVSHIPTNNIKPAFIKRPGALQLPDGHVLTFPPPKIGETRKVYAFGHTYECDHLGNYVDITPRKLFHTAFEANFLALAQSDKPFIPAFLTGLDENNVKAILSKNYIPIGDETEDEMRQLKNYDNLRCAVLEYMEQGGKFDDFVNDVAKFEKDQRQANALGLREVMNLVKKGDVNEAKLMYEAASKMMSDKGYKPIKLPQYVMDAFEQINDD